MRRRSRLKKTQIKKSQRTVILSIIGIIIVLFVLYKFGLETLINFSLFVTGHSSDTNSKSTNNINYLTPPVLNPLPNATNSATLIISGSSTKNSSVNLYVNNSLVNHINVDVAGNYNFQQDLTKGNNQIQTKAKLKNLESDFSNTYNVFYVSEPPKLNLTFPQDGQGFNKNQVGTDNSIQVLGQTDANAIVTVNSFYAVLDENNSFSYTLILQNGDNQIKVIAKDSAGNTTEKDIKVSFSL